MRCIFLGSIAAILFSCNSSGKKEKNDEKKTAAPVELTADKIPASIKVTDQLQQAWQWYDKEGENILILSAVGPVRENDYSFATLHATRWVKEDNKFGETWGHYDSVDSCEFDVTLAFIKDAATITDLDNDGMMEVTFLYRKACRSDVSPASMSLVMHEGNDLFYLKGSSWLQSSPEDSFTVTETDANLETLQGYNKTGDEYMKTFGRYESEKAFASAPPEFLAYARKQWMKFVIERME